MKKKLTITGMTCEHCQKAVETALAKVPGVQHVRVQLKKGEATVKMSDDCAVTDLFTAIEAAGYQGEEKV